MNMTTTHSLTDLGPGENRVSQYQMIGTSVKRSQSVDMSWEQCKTESVE
jgi:hypothetical protein